MLPRRRKAPPTEVDGAISVRALNINFVFPLIFSALGVAGLTKWINGGVALADSMVWVALILSGLGWAATHWLGFIRPIRDAATRDSDVN